MNFSIFYLEMLFSATCNDVSNSDLEDSSLLTDLFVSNKNAALIDPSWIGPVCKEERSAYIVINHPSKPLHEMRGYTSINNLYR